MKSTNLRIPGLVLIDQVIHRDSRGFFSETFNARRFAEAGIACDFVQDNQSLSVDRGVIRGLHFQAQPHAQDKLVRVARGAILDVAVDIRVGSPTFGQHEAVVLSAENWRQLWVPQGFAHGFCTLEPNTEVLYKVSDFYAPEAEFGLAWDDQALEIDWPVEGDEAVLSPKDQEHPRLADLPEYFRYSP